MMMTVMIIVVIMAMLFWGCLWSDRIMIILWIIVVRDFQVFDLPLQIIDIGWLRIGNNAQATTLICSKVTGGAKKWAIREVFLADWHFQVAV